MRIRRRNFLACLPAMPSWGGPSPRADYVTGAVAAARPEPLPEGKRVPFGWKAAAAGDGVVLRFARTGVSLRLTTAIDSREPCAVEARLARSGRVLGVFDMRYSYVFQPFQIPLDPASGKAAAHEGVALRMTSGSVPAWFFSGGGPAPLMPHLLAPGAARPIDEFHARLRGIESVQPFGWMEGCVLDGLADLGYEQAVDAHLALFLPDSRRLVYEDPRSRPWDDRIAGIENTLPFGRIERRRAGHASVDAAIAFWKSHQDDEGCVIDRPTTSAEGSYTVALPLAEVGRLRRARDLEDLALRQLRLRRSRLVAGDALFLRSTPDGKRTYRNWARGVAWYSLGLARTLASLPHRDDTGDLRAELERVSRWSLRQQRPDGLWNCFLDDSSAPPDTSGSAGIAASVALAHRLGAGPAAFREAAARTLRGLEARLTPDGFLAGAAQSNRGGEALQRSDYRVISQMGMGLMGQLIAAVR